VPRSEFLIASSAKELKFKHYRKALFLSYMEKYPEQNKDNSVFSSLENSTFTKTKYDNAQKWLSEISNPRSLGQAESHEFYFYARVLFLQG
jgi:hypothetical protein